MAKKALPERLTDWVADLEAAAKVCEKHLQGDQKDRLLRLLGTLREHGLSAVLIAEKIREEIASPQFRATKFGRLVLELDASRLALISDPDRFEKVVARLHAAGIGKPAEPPAPPRRDGAISHGGKSVSLPAEDLPRPVDD